jgi:mannose/fructose/N-acetylgalactosamine-specific phosphotransferase system component IID
MNKVYKNPSFYAHILVGLMTLLICIIIFKNFGEFKQLNVYKLVILLLLLTIVIGIHGLSHLGLEKIYKYNPLKFELMKNEKMNDESSFFKNERLLVKPTIGTQWTLDKKNIVNPIIEIQ